MRKDLQILKNDERYPKNAIDWLLKEFNVKKNEISSVNFISNFWSPHLLFD